MVTSELSQAEWEDVQGKETESAGVLHLQCSGHNCSRVKAQCDTELAEVQLFLLLLCLTPVVIIALAGTCVGILSERIRSVQSGRLKLRVASQRLQCA